MKGILDYVPGHTVLHHMNPVTKILLSFSICVACFMSDSIPVLLGIIVLDMAIGAVGGVFPKAVSLLKGLCKVCLFLFVLQILFVRDGNKIFLFITDAGVLLAGKIVLRLIGATIPLALVLTVTQMNDLSNALVDVVHMPYKYAFTLTTAVRFIPMFIAEMNGIMEAQTARGVEFDTNHIIRKMKLILPLCVPLLITSVRRADASAMSVEIRGFDLRTRQSGYKKYPFHRRDIVTLACCVGLITAAALI